jgi:mono/diheme cytochrome c family protein
MGETKRWPAFGRTAAKMAAVALGTAIGLAGLTRGTNVAQAADDANVSFTKDIKPIFDHSCVRCHKAGGPRGPAGGLRLDDKEAALKGGKAGHDIVRGKAEDSLVYKLLLDPVPGPNGKPIPTMPRPQQRGAQFKPLPKEQIELIRKWIDQGAEWPDKK